jgi:hypothetical protein
MRRFIATFLVSTTPLFCQSNRGELRLKVIDPCGLGVKTAVQITSEANQYRNTLATTDQGDLDVQRCPMAFISSKLSSLALQAYPLQPWRPQADLFPI